MNRNVSIWRGNEFPPTTKHVWIDDENNFLLHDGSGWKIVTNTDENDNGYFPEVIVWNHTNNMNDFINSGTYKIEGERTRNDDNLPIMNQGVISARLEVFETKSNNNKVITQILNLNNNAGGEGNIYTRSCQNGTWKPWGKLQTNVEVGQITPDDMSNLIDNGIYSGVCVDGATVETFVLIVINNYLASTQAGFGGYISQLKYAIDLNRGNTVKTRTRDAYGIWTEWENIGGSSTLPEATVDTIGGVKLGMVRGDNYTPLVNINPFFGTGVGIKIGSAVLMNSYNGLMIRYDDSLTIRPGYGLSVRLGTSGFYNIGTIVPCVLGTSEYTLDSAVWDNYSIGIPYNPEQFCLKRNGLNLKNDIGSATKVTWDYNSNMDNYIEPGIYDIYGERTNRYDNIPITQAYNGASIAARLTVIASTLQPDNTEKCITQFLQLSNRMGGEGNTYIRTYNENNNGLTGWFPWKKLQGMVEYGVVTDEYGWGITDSPTGNAPDFGMNGFTENGMYSGIYTDDYTLQTPTFVETFVLVVINDYVVSSQAGTPRRISQLKYATNTLTGQCTVKKRVGTGGDSISWSDWEDIGGGNNYLGLKSLTELRDNKTIKSGTYYGLLSDQDNSPFILEVTTNFDTNNVDDKEKLGLKRLLVGTTGNNHIEYISTGRFRNVSFSYNTFTRKNDRVSCNRFEALSNAYSSTMIITKFDDSITIPASYSVLYNHIMNTAKNISNIASVTIKTSPGEYQQDGGSLLFDSIIEVVYNRKQGMHSFPYKYEKLVLNIGIPSKIFVIQPLIELQELE